MVDIKKRNQKVKDFVVEKIKQAKEKTENDFSDLIKDKNLNGILQDLIFVKQNGFRGIVLTAIAGKFLDKKYNPLTNFYDCNPRAIFEQSIWYALTENQIPCGKSDPLNVAKNTNVIDENWAKGKRPEKTSLAVVAFLKELQRSKGKRYEQLTAFFFFRLTQYAHSVSSIRISTVTSTCAAEQAMTEKLINFTLLYPESGTVPQFVIGKLIRLIFNRSSYQVEGDDESVFGTNTTSKKPADIWVLDKKKPVNLYEITVKKVDMKRLDDCVDTLHQQELTDCLVTFICRIPQDLPPLLTGNQMFLEYKGVSFYFVDISSFIRVTLSLLAQEDIRLYMQALTQFIKEITRPTKTKEGWNKLFGQEDDLSSITQ